MKINTLIRILFVEDVIADMELAVHELKEAGIQYEHIRVDTRAAFLSALNYFDPDIIISDYSMPKFDGVEALILSLEQNPLRPFIILTGSMNEEIAVDCLKAGAVDYVLKDHVSRLPFVVREALNNCTLRKEKDAAVQWEGLARKVLEELIRVLDPNVAIANILSLIKVSMHFESVLIRLENGDNFASDGPTAKEIDVPVNGSTALVQLRSEEKVIGMLQIIDRLSDRFTPDLIQYFEGLGASIGIALARKQAERELEEERSYLRMLIDNIPDSFYIKDGQGRKLLNNHADMEFIGLKDPSDVLGKTDAEVFLPHLAQKFNTDDEKVLKSGISLINIEEVVESKQGNKRWLLTSKLPIKDATGNVTGLIGIGRDITERKLLEGKLLNIVNFDMLTDLPNRSLFVERANAGIAQAKRNKTACAVLFIDLDRFKDINDTLGHSVGDELLKDTARKLTECVREVDTIARVGGDEFLIFLSSLDNVQDARQAAERIRNIFNKYRAISNNDVFITASVGIAVYPDDGNDVEELVRNSDMAMYTAKNNGRNSFCFFNENMNVQVIRKMTIEKGLRDAIANEELQLYYQPIFGLGDKKIRGYEALLRWFRSSGGLLAPDEFIPIAEETGHIVPIGEWVLREACCFGKRMIDAGQSPQIVSVNISVAQLRRVNFIQMLKAVLNETGLPPEYLELEITETIFIESFDSALETLKQIRDIGVQISLDGFGTGYSSLSQLQQLPITKLKIDRLFIKKMLNSHQETNLTSAIIDLAHKLRLRVTAEGVETDFQLSQLREDGCDYIQGFLFCHPLPEAKLYDFIT